MDYAVVSWKSDLVEWLLASAIVRNTFSWAPVGSTASYFLYAIVALLGALGFVISIHELISRRRARRANFMGMIARCEEILSDPTADEATRARARDLLKKLTRTL